MDFTTALQTYGPLGALLLFFGYEVIRGLSARGRSQDAREKTLDTALTKIIDTFQAISEKASSANERVADIFDRVTRRLDENSKEVATSLNEAAVSRKEQTTLLQALSGAILNPFPRFGSVIEAINIPILKEVSDRNMDTKQEILTELKALELQLQSVYTQLNARIEHLAALVSNSAATPPAQQTVTVNLPPTNSTETPTVESK